MKRKRRGYLPIWENVERELKNIVAQLGHFPIISDLKNCGGNDLIRAIYKYHGGFSAVRERMGYQGESRQGERKPKGYWPVWKNFEREMGKVIHDLGHFPNYSELCDLRGNDLIKATRYHGGLSAVRVRMGYQGERKPRGYWPVWENVKGELRIVINELGHFPNNGELGMMHMTSLRQAICEYHGGFHAVRKKMGYELVRMPNGYLKDFDNFRSALEDVFAQLGHFPRHSELQMLKRTDLVNAAQKYHGGLRVVQEKMGFADSSETEKSDLEGLLQRYTKNGD